MMSVVCSRERFDGLAVQDGTLKTYIAFEQGTEIRQTEIRETKELMLFPQRFSYVPTRCTWR